MARSFLPGNVALVTLTLAASVAVAQNAPPPPTDPPVVTTAPAADLPEASAVIDRAIDAHGGAEAIASITSVQYSITTEQPGSSSIFRVRAAPPDKTLITIDAQVGRMEFGRNGDVAWRHNASTGFQLIPDTQLGQVTRLHPLGLLMRLSGYRDRGQTAGRATVQDRSCIKLSLPSEQGEVFVYFDEEMGLLRGLEEIRTNASTRIALMTTFDDYRAVAPLNLFHVATMSFGGQPLGALRISDVQYNTVGVELFTVPAEVSKLVPASRPTTQPAPRGDQ